MTATPYTVCLSPRIQQQLPSLSPSEQRLVLRLAAALAIHPRPPDAIRIAGMTGLYRETIQDIHVIYKIEEQEVILLFIRK